MPEYLPSANEVSGGAPEMLVQEERIHQQSAANMLNQLTGPYKLPDGLFTDELSLAPLLNGVLEAYAIIRQNTDSAELDRRILAGLLQGERARALVERLGAANFVGERGIPFKNPAAHVSALRQVYATTFHRHKLYTPGNVSQYLSDYVRSGGDASSFVLPPKAPNSRKTAQSSLADITEADLDDQANITRWLEVGMGGQLDEMQLKELGKFLLGGKLDRALSNALKEPLEILGAAVDTASSHTYEHNRALAYKTEEFRKYLTFRKEDGQLLASCQPFQVGPDASVNALLLGEGPKRLTHAELTRRRQAIAAALRRIMAIVSE